MDKGLNELLKWGIENASTTANDPDAAPPINRGLNPDAMAALFGGPSDADLMKMSMAAIESVDPAVSVDDKVVAFDNLEQLVESLDNANLLSNLGLWTPLLAQLDSEHAELRKMAAWCVGTAVQNNESSQERMLAMGGVEKLVRRAVDADETLAVRKKAVYALSSACRNYQPAMDAAMVALEKGDSKNKETKEIKKVDANNMEAVDEVMNKIKAGFK